MLLPLSECSKLTGISRSGLMKAISRGRVSGTKDPQNGQWSIEASELSRVYPILSKVGDGLTPDETSSPVVAERVHALETQVEMLLSERDDLRRRLDAEADERRNLQRMLTHQVDKGSEGRADLMRQLDQVEADRRDLQKVLAEIAATKQASGARTPWPLYVIALATLTAAGIAVWHVIGQSHG